MKITILGVDPALRNMGLARCIFDTETEVIEVERLRLVQTDSQSGKTVRKSSDDLRCAQFLHQHLCEEAYGASLIAAEVPTGTQSARGAMSNGISLGVLACAPLPIIEVNPTEVKMATVGKKNASKQEMIDWAYGLYPQANWLTKKRKGEVTLTNANEHLADAIAAVKASISTPQFQSTVSIMKSLAA